MTLETKKSLSQPEALKALATRSERSLLIAIADLTRYTAYARRTEDAELAETVNGFYQRVTAAIDDAGGTVVKFMGDAALIVFSDDAVDVGVDALLAMKDDIDRYWSGLGWESKMILKVHFGTVIAGPFGSAAHARFDVIGSAINQTFRMDSSGFALSTAAFRKLSPELRKRFKKHTPPITYIRTQDRHRM